MPEGLLASFDEDVAGAIGLLSGSLSPSAARRAHELIKEAGDAAAEKLSTLLAPQRRSTRDRSQSRDGVYLIAEAGLEDPERPAEERSLQSRLSDLLDEQQLDDLSGQLQEQDHRTDARRIRKLRDPSVSRD